MSIPVIDEEIYGLTDFHIWFHEDVVKTDYIFYEGKYDGEHEDCHSPRGHSLYTITVPPFCIGQAKLGVFLKDFSTLLDEMLVKWDRDVVQRLYTETMQRLFPDDAADYELGFYEKQGFLYCTIQFSEEGHKKAFGCGWQGTSGAHEASIAFFPPVRLMFEAKDPALRELQKGQAAKVSGRASHPRRPIGLRDYFSEEK